MRLLQVDESGEFSLVEYVGRHIPPYAILSHTWGRDIDKVTFQDLINGRGKGKPGYRKVRFCMERAARDGLQFSWIDTCCIDKSSSAELQEAINSMFQWYHKADKCYVYLSDVSVSGSGGIEPSTQQAWKRDFQGSRWFTRGWTLQELLAPTSVQFFSAEGKPLGNKASLRQEIHAVTRISPQALQGTPLDQFSIEMRLSWAERRETKRDEDKAYALLGIFQVHMPLIYSEGENNAFRRLREEINKTSKDLLQQQNLTQNCRVESDMVRGMGRVSEG
jgi:hypothetical protein